MNEPPVFLTDLAELAVPQRPPVPVPSVERFRGTLLNYCMRAYSGLNFQELSFGKGASQTRAKQGDLNVKDPRHSDDSITSRLR
jgi:hypothetical protein